ncbi:MAG: FixH family protein [Roseovarius sp.]|nr:FixH family protein [Roseovarius sp.]
MTERETTGREITGRHVLIGFIAFFGVIIGVNILLAVSAVRSFPGLEVSNGYVASQSFDARRTAQEALGWDLQAGVSGGMLYLAFTDAAGQPVRPARIEASVGRPTEDIDDTEPALVWVGERFEAPVALGKGKWILRLRAYAGDGTLFQQRRPLVIDRS